MNSIHRFGEKVHHAADDLAAGTVRTARGVAAGAIAGIIASWVMSQYQQIECRPVNVRRREAFLDETPLETSTAPEPAGDGATVKTAEAISTRLLNHDLSPCAAKIAGPMVHYGYGAAVGALYGGLAELIPAVSSGFGVPYATAVFVGGDEIAAPAMGLSKSPMQVPAAKHASGLASHFVYGVTLDIARRVVRRLI